MAAAATGMGTAWGGRFGTLQGKGMGPVMDEGGWPRAVHGGYNKKGGWGVGHPGAGAGGGGVGGAMGPGGALMSESFVPTNAYQVPYLGTQWPGATG